MHAVEQTLRTFASTDFTRVCFRALDADEAIRYIGRKQPFGGAGSFKAEALGTALFERIETHGLPQA